jgi:hypothetical protein
VSTGRTSPEVICAAPADLDVLSEVIAEAFHELAPSRWLIADPEARRAIFPGYFRLQVAYAMTTGLVHTTPGRNAVALWLSAGPEPTARWPVTGSGWLTRPRRGPAG